MKRTLSLLSLGFFLFASTPPVYAVGGEDLIDAIDRFGNQSLTRAEVLTWSVEYLYGEVWNSVTPATYDQAVIDIANAVGALDVWGEGAGDNLGVSTTRCQTLQLVFDLAQVDATQSAKLSYRDVQTGKKARVVQRALTWDLIDPIRHTLFGCDRSIRANDLSRILSGIGKRVNLPLSQPSTVYSPRSGRTNTARTTRTRSTTRGQKRPTATERRNTTRKGDEPQKITIIAPSVDSGARRSIGSLPGGDTLSAVWGIVESKYLYMDKLDREELEYALAEKVMEALDDPYTTFFRPSRAKSFDQRLEGELSGIGAQVEAHSDGGIMVVSPITGTPAMRAGIHPGDRIISVDGESILEMNLQDSVNLIKGPVGTTVVLKVERNGGKLEFKIVRAKISIPEIEITRQDGVAIVKLMQFGERSINDFSREMKKVVDANPRGIVLDLRNNPGGYLDAAIVVLGNFLPKDSAVALIKSPRGLHSETTAVSYPSIPAEMPVAILVNKGSASASEIVAGAMQDTGRATVFGSQTFGKGTVQEVFKSDKGWSIKYTIAEWLTPNGLSIQGVGITPDIIIEDSLLEGGRDEVLLRAIQAVKSKK